MKVLREIYDFVTGGSIVAPVGLVLGVAAAAVCAARGLGVASGVALLATLAVTLAGSALERPR